MFTSSPEETKGIAAELVTGALPGDVYLLTGTLGAGKTCFVQGFLAALGVQGSVTSPTYVYETRYEARGWAVYHLDLYRVEEPARLHALGIEERLEERENLLLIEWPEILEGHLPIPVGRRIIRVTILPAGKTGREIRITTDGDGGKEKEAPVRQGG